MKQYGQHDLFGEHGAFGHIADKSDFSKGEQAVSVSNVHHICPFEYIKRCNLYKKPPEWTWMIQIQVWLVIKLIVPMVKETPNIGRIRKIYSNFPCVE